MPLIDKVFDTLRDKTLEEFNEYTNEIIRDCEEKILYNYDIIKREMNEEQIKHFNKIINYVKDVEDLKLHSRFNEGVMFGFSLIKVLDENKRKKD